MQIPFKQNHLSQQFIRGVIAIGVGTVMLLINRGKTIGAEVAFLGLGIAYLAEYGFKRKRPYLISKWMRKP